MKQVNKIENMKQGKFLRIFVVVENVGERFFFWQNGGDEGEGSGLLIGDYLDLAGQRGEDDWEVK